MLEDNWKQKKNGSGGVHSQGTKDGQRKPRDGSEKAKGRTDTWCGVLSGWEDVLVNCGNQ